MTTPHTALRGSALVSVVALFLVLLSGPALAAFSRSQQKCAKELNRGLEKVASEQAKLNRDCVRNGRLGKTQKLGPGGSIESCLLDDPKLRVDRARQKTIEKEIKRCQGPLPPFGSTDADTVNDAGVEQMLELLHDIFNTDLDASIVPKDSQQEGSQQNLTSRCQEEIVIRAGKCMNTRLSEFRKCAKAGIKGGKQSADQRALAVTGATAGEKAQQILVRFFAGHCFKPPEIAGGGCFHEMIVCFVYAPNSLPGRPARRQR